MHLATNPQDFINATLAYMRRQDYKTYEDPDIYEESEQNGSLSPKELENLRLIFSSPTGVLITQVA